MDFNSKIAYLENEDFDREGKLKLKVNVPVMVMVQGAFCGYCREAKPAFDAAASKLGSKVMCATIQIDGNDSEKALAGRLDSVLQKPFAGVPVFAGFKNGAVKVYNGPRTEASLVEFANSL